METSNVHDMNILKYSYIYMYVYTNRHSATVCQLENEPKTYARHNATNESTGKYTSCT